ncbi:MAG: hypothetical protein V1816_06310 [Pseudomonadota bacterium]
MMSNVSEIIKNHVSLSNTCIDRLYINGYVPNLQTSGQLCYFLREHLGNVMPSPVLFTPLRERFIEDVEQMVVQQDIPLIQFIRGQRKDDIANDLRSRYKSDEGVVFVGVAQEKTNAFKAQKIKGATGHISFDFSRQSVAVKHYYFYVQDIDWGPAFVKVCTYIPYPIKIYLNGHEWVKQRLRREGLAFESLDNGFRSCPDPQRLQEISDELCAEDVQSFFDRWSNKLPWPLTQIDRQAGYHHRLSIWECEVSLTQVFQRPVQGRHFFESVIRDNLDLGRPDRVSLLFPTKYTRRTPPPPRGYRTRIITSGVNPSLHIDYKQTHVKQYFKEEQALRTETTINNTYDFHVGKNIRNLEHLRDRGKQINRKLLEAECVGSNCALSQDTLDQIQCSTLLDGQRASALRFGDPRVMALMHALCHFFHLAVGFRNKELRQHIAALLGVSPDQYTTGKMTYDLRRLRLKGLIHRIPKSNRYTVTTFGLQAVFFWTKVHLRIMRPGMAAIISTTDQMPQPLQQAFKRLEREINKIWDQANIQPKCET